MKVLENPLPGLFLIEPNSYPDERGWFLVAYQASAYQELGPFRWQQDNVSHSSNSILRGLHTQHPNDQLKLVQVLHGAIFDVAVDIRLGSPTFGRWFGVELNDQNHLQLLVPDGFVHGFVVLSQTATVYYKAQGLYDKSAEVGVRWNDPDIGIDWPVTDPILNERDRTLPLLSEIDPARLPQYPGD